MLFVEGEEEGEQQQQQQKPSFCSQGKDNSIHFTHLNYFYFWKS